MSLNATDGAAVGQQALFGWLDHLAFALMLALSAAIGVYFGVWGRAKNTAQVDYLHGGKKMNVLPVAVSMASSYVSGVTVMGVPAEVYLYGSVYGWICLSVVLLAIITNYVFLPVFYELQLTSTYEYLERRFSRLIRIVASACFTLNLVLHMPLYVYTPAIALSQVSGINIHWITPLVCAVCIFYTMLGGLKAVVWTDFLQSAVTLVAFFAVFTLGVVGAGGFSEVWRTADHGGRVSFMVMTPDPFVRSSFWAVVIGATASALGGCAVHQGMVQKFMALPDMTACRKSLAGFTFGIVLINAMCVFAGFLLYTAFQDCDPIKTHEVSRPDQLLPFYVLKVAGHIPGLSGLFVAGIFGAALSSMSGILNALSATLYEDFLLPFMPEKRSDVLVNFIMQSIVFVVGLITVGMVFVVERLGTILELAYSVSGICNGVLLGMFTLGMLVPSANTKGVIAGSLCGALAVGTILVGAQFASATGRVKYPPLPTSVDGCPGNVTTTLHAAAATAAASSTTPDDVPLLFRLSYLYYTFTGALVVVTVGWVVSRLTGPLGPGDLDPALLAPQVRPTKCRRQSHREVEPAVTIGLLPNSEKDIEEK